jgi:hypothetical protein
MASQLNMPHIRRMMLRPDIILLQNPRSIKVINITSFALSPRIQRSIVKMFDHTFDFWFESAALNVSCAGGREAASEA